MIAGTLRTNDRQRQRVAGIRAALADANIHLEEWRVSEQPLTLAGGRAGCSQLLSLGEMPNAIIGCIDMLAIGALIEAQGRELIIPRDLSVVGIDNLELGAHLSPALTTVHIPTFQIGEMAARQILARVHGEDVPQKVEFPVALVVRPSAGHAVPGLSFARTSIRG